MFLLQVQQKSLVYLLALIVVSSKRVPYPYAILDVPVFCLGIIMDNTALNIWVNLRYWQRCCKQHCSLNGTFFENSDWWSHELKWDFERFQAYLKLLLVMGPYKALFETYDSLFETFVIWSCQLIWCFDFKEVRCLFYWPKSYLKVQVSNKRDLKQDVWFLLCIKPTGFLV